MSRFRPETAALLLIDHQVGTMRKAASQTFEDTKRNALLLAKAGKILGLPIVLTADQEENRQGPLLAELAQILPEAFADRINRDGTVDAMDDPAFAAAVEATGRQQLIIAGVTNDVCTVFPTLTLLERGFEVQVVADAGASHSVLSDEIAVRRMDKAGATITSTIQVIAELCPRWSTPHGAQLIKAMAETLGA